MMLKHETPLKPASPKRRVIIGPVVRMGKKKDLRGEKFWLSSPDKTAPHSSLSVKPRIGFRVPALRCDLE